MKIDQPTLHQIRKLFHLLATLPDVPALHVVNDPILNLKNACQRLHQHMAEREDSLKRFLKNFSSPPEQVEPLDVNVIPDFFLYLEKPALKKFLKHYANSALQISKNPEVEIINNLQLGKKRLVNKLIKKMSSTKNQLNNDIISLYQEISQINSRQKNKIIQLFPTLSERSVEDEINYLEVEIADKLFEDIIACVQSFPLLHQDSHDYYLAALTALRASIANDRGTRHMLIGGFGATFGIINLIDHFVKMCASVYFPLLIIPVGIAAFTAWNFSRLNNLNNQQNQIRFQDNAIDDGLISAELKHAKINYENAYREYRECIPGISISAPKNIDEFNTQFSDDYINPQDFDQIRQREDETLAKKLVPTSALGRAAVITSITFGATCTLILKFIALNIITAAGPASWIIAGAIGAIYAFHIAYYRWKQVKALKNLSDTLFHWGYHISCKVIEIAQFQRMTDVLNKKNLILNQKKSHHARSLFNSAFSLRARAGNAYKSCTAIVNNIFA